jgi:hypothetical protein
LWPVILFLPWLSIGFAYLLKALIHGEQDRPSWREAGRNLLG